METAGFFSCCIQIAKMCSGRYSMYVKPKYESDPIFRSKVLARNELYRSKQLADNPVAFRQRRADASRRCYGAHNEEYREKKRSASAKQAHMMRKTSSLPE